MKIKNLTREELENAYETLLETVNRMAQEEITDLESQLSIALAEKERLIEEIVNAAKWVDIEIVKVEGLDEAVRILKGERDGLWQERDAIREAWKPIAEELTKHDSNMANIGKDESDDPYWYLDLKVNIVRALNRLIGGENVDKRGEGVRNTDGNY